MRSKSKFETIMRGVLLALVVMVTLVLFTVLIEVPITARIGLLVVLMGTVAGFAWIVGDRHG